MENVAVSADFWAGKRVLVTGHTGFKGSWLALWLQSLGADVFGYALAPPTEPSLFELARVGDGTTSLIGDIRDLPALRAALVEAAPEIVIHMAAQPLVRESYREPVATYATNVMGTVHLLESVRTVESVRAVINVTSDKCYENRERAWGYRESDALGGHDPYSSSKGCAELITAAYRRSFFHPDDHHRHGVALASARAGNVIGGGDWAEERLVPDIMRAIGNREPVIVRNPQAIRPWQHVLEPLAGYLLLAERLWCQGGEFAEAWNFGPCEEDARPVGWIAERLTGSWGEGASWRHDGSEQPHEANHLQLDSSKARSRLGWRPRWPLGTALERIVEWYRAYEQGADLQKLTLAQIQQYQQPEGSTSLTPRLRVP